MTLRTYKTLSNITNSWQHPSFQLQLWLLCLISMSLCVWLSLYRMVMMMMMTFVRSSRMYLSGVRTQSNIQWHLFGSVLIKIRCDRRRKLSLKTIFLIVSLKNDVEFHLIKSVQSNSISYIVYFALNQLYSMLLSHIVWTMEDLGKCE